MTENEVSTPTAAASRCPKRKEVTERLSSNADVGKRGHTDHRDEVQAGEFVPRSDKRR
jgi:hypothetical protein